MAAGQLRVYFGAAPGVGKTYKMLEEPWITARAMLDDVIATKNEQGKRITLITGGVLAPSNRRADDEAPG